MACIFHVKSLKHDFFQWISFSIKVLTFAKRRVFLYSPPGSPSSAHLPYSRYSPLYHYVHHDSSQGEGVCEVAFSTSTGGTIRAWTEDHNPSGWGRFPANKISFAVFILRKTYLSGSEHCASQNAVNSFAGNMYGLPPERSCIYRHECPLSLGMRTSLRAWSLQLVLEPIKKNSLVHLASIRTSRRHRRFE